MPGGSPARSLGVNNKHLWYYLVGFDGTDSSNRAIEFAASRAKMAGAWLCLVHILEWSAYSFHTPEELAGRHKRREEELLKAAGIEVESEVRHGHVGEQLCAIAKEKGALLIFVGRTGDSVFTVRLLGGLAIALAQASPVPVTIVP